MTNKEQANFMDKDQILDFVFEKLDYFSKKDQVHIEEIGDGNINYVYRLVEEGSGKSLVVKYSDQLLRSSQRPLDIRRSQIEAQALKIKGSLCPGMVPEVYYYDQERSLIVMEDISAYKNLRFELLKGNFYENLSEDLSDFLAGSLLPTTDLVLSRKEKKEAQGFFINPDLCDISEDLVFTEPYYNYKNRNILSPGTEDFVEKKLYQNIRLQGEVLKLKDRFQTYSQGLLHGDLHTGSIFVGPGGIKVIDSEFAFYGPLGYDIGNLWANLIFPLAHHLVRESGEKIIDQSMNLLEETIDKTIEKLERAYEDLVEFPYFKNPAFKRTYLRDLIADSFGYAGCELIRRTVGDSKTLDLTSIEGHEDRKTLDQFLINIGSFLIENRYQIENGSQVIEFIEEEHDKKMIRYDKNMPFLLKYENVAWYENGKVTILDRRLYPNEVKFVICKSFTDVVDAIKNMVTQSAGPYTAVGMGMALAAYESQDLPNEKRIRFLEDAEKELRNSRPTTSGRYGKVTGRCLKIAKDAIKNDLDPVPLIVEDTIEGLNRRYKTMQKVGDNLIKLVPENGTILTQCYGETIIGALIVAAKREKKKFKVICAETRPYLQGARLTASCFAEEGFDTTVITDNMVADLMAKGKIDLFTSAADIITEDGSVVNKVGTYQIALLAKNFRIPYFVTGIPDEGVENLDQVRVEMRDPEEVLSFQGEKLTQMGVKGYYPAFDKTPADLVRGIVTDKEIYKPENLGAYFQGPREEFY